MSRKDWDIIDWKVRCSELAFEVERLQKDRERLEWLVETSHFILPDGQRPSKWAVFSGLREDRKTRWHNGWLNAIDDAMEGE